MWITAGIPGLLQGELDLTIDQPYSLLNCRRAMDTSETLKITS